MYHRNTPHPPVEEIKTGSELQNIKRGALLSFLCIVKLRILPEKNSLNNRIAHLGWKLGYSGRRGIPRLQMSGKKALSWCACVQSSLSLLTHIQRFSGSCMAFKAFKSQSLHHLPPESSGNILDLCTCNRSKRVTHISVCICVSCKVHVGG